MRTLTFGFLNLNVPPASSAAPLDVIRSAKAAGFRSVGIRASGRRVDDDFPSIIGNAQAIQEIRRVVVDAGMRISSVTGYGFFPDLALGHHERVLDVAAELGSSLCILNVYFDDHDAFADQLSAYAAAASERNIRAGIEFMPFSGVRTLQQTSALLERSGAANAGYIMDALHLTRSGGTIDDIARVDRGKIFLGQICDVKGIGSVRTDDELRLEARAQREYPGEGELDLFAFVDALPPGIELEIEVPRSDVDGMTFEARARRTGAVFRDFMHAYESARNRA